MPLPGKAHPSGVHPLLQLQGTPPPQPLQGYPHVLQGLTQGWLK